MDGSKKAVVVAASADLAIAIVKFVAAAASGSASLVSEGIHSVVDTMDQALMLLGQHRSAKPPDAQHPFGYGMELYFWSTVVCTVIFGLGGGGSLLEGLVKVLRHGRRIEAVGWTYAALAVALVLETISLTVGYHKLRKHHRRRPLWRVFRQSKDPSVLTVVLEDSAAVLGVTLAFLGVLLSQVFDDAIFDGIAAMCIGLLLCTIAVLLIRESRSLVIGESADPDLVERLRQVLGDDPSVQRVGGVLTMQFGPDQVLVNAQLEFHDELTSDELECSIDRIESRVRKECPLVKRIFLELESLTRRSREQRPPS